MIKARSALRSGPDGVHRRGLILGDENILLNATSVFINHNRLWVTIGNPGEPIKWRVDVNDEEIAVPAAEKRVWLCLE